VKNVFWVPHNQPSAANPSDTPPRQQRQRKANTRYSQESQTPPTNPKQSSQQRQSQASQEPESQQTAKKGKPKQNPTTASQKRNNQPPQVPDSRKKAKKGKPSNFTQDSDNSNDEHVEASSPSPPPPPSSEPPADTKADEEVPSHAYHRKQNAQAIASFLGIFNTVATALLITAIPNPITRRATIKRIRTILLESAYASWWKHWQHILNLETKPATVNLRKRHKYTDNALHKKPPKQRRKHSESPHRTHAKKRKPPDEPNSTPDELGSAHKHRTPAPRVVAASL
jgi:hypothetical protein